MMEEEELEWMVSGWLPEMSSVLQGTGPVTSQQSRGPSRRCSPSTAYPHSKSHAEEKLKEKLTEKSKGMTLRKMKGKAKKSKTFKESENENENENVEDETMEHANAQPVK
jgi:hypothetical protein